MTTYSRRFGVIPGLEVIALAGLITALGWLSQKAYAQEPAAAVSSTVGRMNIPLHGRTLQSFVPEGYEIGVEVRSDFNGDGREDVAALLWISPDSTQTRPFIILLQQADGTYRLSERVDYFTNADDVGCGAGNWHCVPDILAKGRALVIGMARGSAAGYVIYENEFRLVSSTWRRVRQASYERGLDISCPLANQTHDAERCFEQGVSKDFKTGVATNYCRFVNDHGEQTRVQRSQSKIGVGPLKRLAEAEWDFASQ